MKNNYYVINYKFRMLFCSLCREFIFIKKLFLLRESLHLLVKCGCYYDYTIVSLQRLILDSTYTYEFLTIRRNYFSSMKNNKWNWEINKNNTEQKINEYECNCNQDKIKYCIDCHKFICKKCKILHYYHRQFNYEPNNYINDKNLHKLEKYCYQSYIYLKNLLKLQNHSSLN